MAKTGSARARREVGDGPEREVSTDDELRATSGRRVGAPQERIQPETEEEEEERADALGALHVRSPAGEKVQLNECICNVVQTRKVAILIGIATLANVDRPIGSPTIGDGAPRRG